MAKKYYSGALLMSAQQIDAELAATLLELQPAAHVLDAGGFVTPVVRWRLHNGELYIYAGSSGTRRAPDWYWDEFDREPTEREEDFKAMERERGW